MNLENEEKFELNKKIRGYKGTNSFLISLQKQLKSVNAKRIEFNGRNIKILSDKQYEVAKNLLM